jgi:hypothetical protein
MRRHRRRPLNLRHLGVDAVREAQRCTRWPAGLRSAAEAEHV